MAAVIDLKYLLAILNGVTITDSFAEQVIDKWPSKLCAPPVDGKDLGRRVQEISQKWVGNDLASDPGFESGRASTPTPTAVSTPFFGFPPTPCFVPTSSARKKDMGSVSWAEAIIIDSDVENEKPVVTKKDPGLPTPDSLKKRAPMGNQVTPTIKRVRKTIKAAKPSTKVDEKLPETSFTLSSTRKRRSKVDYEYVHEDKVFDRPEEDDGDFEYEHHDDDERLDQNYEKHYPKLDIPCKRQKTKK